MADNRRQAQAGFTLIELMITVAIVGILAAIAYPSYINQVRESRRTDARSLLLNAANRQERFYTSSYEYADQMSELGLNGETENGFYTVTIPQANATRFTLQASATGDQRNDECVTLTVNEVGQRGAQNGSDDNTTAECW